MKPPQLDYVAPTDLEAALDALAEPGAVVLAGGQSLVLELVYRERRPRLLVDLNRVPGLDGLDDSPDGLVVGALVRHAAVEAAPPAGAGSAVRRLMSTIAPYVAHPPIRSRGTVVGSLAWAHPAAEWNALAAAVDAEVHLRSRTGGRVIDADAWFLGDQQTARTPDELVHFVRFPALPPGTGTGFAEHRRTHASFADVAVVAAVTVADDTVTQLRLAVVGVADRPLRLRPVEDALTGARPGALAGQIRRRVGAEVSGDDHRRAVAAELAGRAVAEAVAA